MHPHRDVAIKSEGVRGMKKVEVFDPAMCCSSGVCGPKVDPALVRFAADLNWLAGQEVSVERYNLAQQPQAFAANEIVKSELREHGSECLPLIVVDGSVVSRGQYPTRSELATWAGLEAAAVAEPVQSTGPALSLPVINDRCC
jgi:hypothetical protein